LTVSNDINYGEVTKTHNMQLCALDEGLGGRSTWKCYANEAYWYKIGW